MRERIARREQLKALLAGSIATLGRNYVISLEAVNAETGDVMAREQAEAADKEQVLTSLGTATSRLRKKLGESLASVQRFDVPLPKATTSSLDALHAYSLALSDGRQVPSLRRFLTYEGDRARPELCDGACPAVRVYANTDQSALARRIRKSNSTKDRVSERERFFIVMALLSRRKQDWEKALELAQSWTAHIRERPSP